MTNPQTAATSTWREGLGLVASLATVLFLTMVVLRSADLAPQMLAGQRGGIARFQSVERAERALGARAWLPAYFPDSLRWPPTSIRVFKGPPAAMALEFAGRGTAAVRLVIYQAEGARASVPMALMPAGRVLHQTPVSLDGGAATLFRLQLPDGRIGNDLVWYRETDTVALRYVGPAEELVTITRSLRRGRP